LCKCFEKKIFTKVKLGKNFDVEEYGKRYYNSTGMVLQWYYNGITMVLVSMPEILGEWKSEFWQNFTYEKFENFEIGKGDLRKMKSGWRKNRKNLYFFLPKDLHMSIFFCNFAPKFVSSKRGFPWKGKKSK